MRPLNVTYVSHGCIKISGEFGTLLADPWILNEPIYAFSTWKFPAAVMPPEEVMKDVDYVYLSHPHEDHLHIPSFDHVPRDKMILLPEYMSHPCLRAQTVELTLREMGFYNIRKLKPWQTLMLGGNTPFTVIPCANYKYWEWENSGFVLEHHDCKLLNMNDCPSDAELYERVNREFGTLDIAFIQYAGVSMFPGCFRMPREELEEASRRRKIGWGQQKNLIEMLKVKRIAPFAGDFCWLDERMAHCNWSNRATPQLFADFVQSHYPEKNIEVVIMYPSDGWQPASGLKRNHPEIDWSNYLAEIEKLRIKFKPKVDAIRHWLEESNDLSNLEARSRAYTDHLNHWLTHDFIDFNVRVRVHIEGPNSNVSFVMKSSPEEGFRFDWEDKGECDQSLFIREKLWAAVLEAKLLLTNIQWNAEGLHHVPFRPEIARFWFWFENHVDLNNRNVQALIGRNLHPELAERIRPQLGVFPLAGEWDCSWLSAPAAERKYGS